MPADLLDDRDPAGIDPRAVRLHFSRAVATYDAAAVLQREVGARMAERLDVVRLAPHAILDAGCGTGEALPELAARYPKAQRVALDIALPMLAAARARADEHRSVLNRLLAPLRTATGASALFACGDILALPFAHDTIGLVWSNLALQWVVDLPRALAEFHRVLEVGGLLTFTTFGPDTLKEVRAAFNGIDTRPHVSRFADMHDVGDMLVQAGFADPVLQMEMMTLTYGDARALVHDLKAIGATNATRGRERGLMGRGRWQRVLAALDGLRTSGPERRIPATYEVIYGHAWKAASRYTAEGHAIVTLTHRSDGQSGGSWR
jgi:malonyl-CoA O-methyltransferase